MRKLFCLLGCWVVLHSSIRLLASVRIFTPACECGSRFQLQPKISYWYCEHSSRKDYVQNVWPCRNLPMQSYRINYFARAASTHQHALGPGQAKTALEVFSRSIR